MKAKLSIILFFLLLLILSGCSNFAPAPIKDGSYLTYETEQQDFYSGGEHTYRYTIKFKKVKNGVFEVTAYSNGSPDESLIKPNKKTGKTLVNAVLRRLDTRKELTLENIGPIWVPGYARKKGTNEGIDFVFFGVSSDKITTWKNWKVYVVTASVFRGAISGHWFYDTKTGFLVGFKLQTAAMYDYEIPTTTLIDTNIEGLFS